MNKINNDVVFDDAKVSASKLPAPLGLSRRRLIAGTAASGGMLLGFGRLPNAEALAAVAAPVTTTTVNFWVVIGTDETIKIYCPGSEMGQGVISGMPQVIAEELKVDWRKVTTEQAPYGTAYDNPINHRRFTGGSNNMRSWFSSLLKIGATGREMLIAAAAQQLKEPASNLHCSLGSVVSSSGKSATYGSLAALAATMPVPGNPPILSTGKPYTLVGQSVARPDIPLKVDGSAKFGIDVRVDGMMYASVKQCPVLGGTVASAPTGAGVVPLKDSLGRVTAVAVTGSNTWAAIQAARALSVSWSVPSGLSASVDSQAIAQTASTLMASGKPEIAESTGDVTKAMKAAAKTLTMTYNLPYLAHACMEVLNCTVSVTTNSCTVWAPTQAPDAVAALAASLTGLPLSAITVNSMLMGGGLGRKGETDYVSQAIQVAMKIGKPVKLVWSREEDFTHDFYRPMAVSKLQVGLDAAGGIAAWYNRLVSPSILARVFPAAVAGGKVDGQSVEGAIAVPYAMGPRLVEYLPLASPVPVGFWRSVANSINAFVVESAIDEIALALGQTPLKLRQTLLAGDARRLGVLNAAAAMAAGVPLPAGHARGLAVHMSFGTYVAEVVEIALTSSGGIRVVHVWCAVDCGLAVNPDSVVAQMQGGINHGLNAALWGQMTWQNGQPDQQNFDNYPMMRMGQSPLIDVKIVNTTPGAALGGIGEPGVPPAAPALANAYFALTGKRVRSLPLLGGGGGGGG